MGLKKDYRKQNYNNYMSATLHQKMNDRHIKFNLQVIWIEFSLYVFVGFV